MSASLHKQLQDPEFNPIKMLMRTTLDPTAAPPTLESIKRSKTKFQYLIRTKNSSGRPFEQNLIDKTQAPTKAKKQAKESYSETMASSVS
jgi:hypothetical protein